MHTYNYSHNTSYYITSVRDGQPSRTTASVYVSGLLRTTASYLGWLCRTTPDYAGLLPDYFEPRRTTSGLLRSARPDTAVLGTSPEGQPGPRGNHLLEFLSPLCRFRYIYGCRIRAGFPYIQWRGLLPTLVVGLSSQGTKSYVRSSARESAPN